MIKFVVVSGVFLTACAVALIFIPNLDSHYFWLGRTHGDLLALTSAVDAFAQKNHRIPTPEEGLASVMVRDAPRASRCEGNAIDGAIDYWGTPFVYKVVDAARQQFVVYSAGPNHKDDLQGYDDVVSGSKEYRCELYDDCWRRDDYIFTGATLTSLASLLVLFAMLVVSLARKWRRT